MKPSARPLSSQSPTTPPVVLQVLPAMKDGGVETSALEMATYLKQQGWVALVASSGGPRVGLLEKVGATHIKLPLASKAPWIILGNAFRLAGVIRRNKVTLVHARSRAPAWSAYLAARWTGVPFLTTFHGTYGLGGGWPKRFYNSVMLRGPRVIANSQFIREHIIEKYGFNPSRIDVATRGVEVARYNPENYTPTDIAAVRSELDVPDDVPLILMVGRITRWKGHDLVLEALATLADLPWVMAFAGGVEKDSAYMRELEARTEALGLADRVRWLGSRTDGPRLLAASQLALSASTRPEAFGRVAIEAMAMGVPVVATGHGGSLETVVDGATGWLVMPGQKTSEGPMFGMFTPQAFGQKMRQALQSGTKLASMGKAARAHVLQAFTVEHCCSAEMACYKKVLAQSANSPSGQ